MSSNEPPVKKKRGRKPKNKDHTINETTEIKKARKLSGGGALYAWLYRNDKHWLLAFNRL